MWCTRWYLPLLLLPFPTAPPLFLLILLLSLTLHARPCLYCVVLLAALFSSSCHWAPTPLDIPSQVLREALPRLLYGPPTPLTDLLHPTPTPTPTPAPTTPDTSHYTFSARLERPKRCWCAPHDMFEPFNLTRWDSRSTMSVIARRDFWGWLVDEPIVFPPPPAPAPAPEPTTNTATASASASPSWQSRWATIQERVGFYGRGKSSTQPSEPLTTPTPIEEPSKNKEEPVEESAPTPLPWLRRQYDLRPYGGGVVIDFGWGRPKATTKFNPESHVFKPYRAQP